MTNVPIIKCMGQDHNLSHHKYQNCKVILSTCSLVICLFINSIKSHHSRYSMCHYPPSVKSLLSALPGRFSNINSGLDFLLHFGKHVFLLFLRFWYFNLIPITPESYLYSKYTDPMSTPSPSPYTLLQPLTDSWFSKSRNSRFHF